MKRNRFTDEQIIGILKEHEAGTPVLELCRKHGCQSARKNWTPITPLMGSILHAETHQQQQPKTAGANSKLDKTWGQGHSGASEPEGRPASSQIDIVFGPSGESRIVLHEPGACVHSGFPAY